MTTAFPTSLDTLPDIGATDKEDDTGKFHDVVHDDANDSIEALEAKVGIDSSTVTTSLDYARRHYAAGEALGRSSRQSAPAASNDDEFLGTSFAGAWGEVNRASSPGSYASKYGSANYKHTGSATSSDLHALVKTFSISTGDYLETRITTFARTSHFAAGLIFADGNTFNAGNQVMALWYNYSGTNFLRIESKSNYSGGSGEGSSLSITGFPECYVRLKYESSNTWGLYFSPDGFAFYTVTNSFAKTMTPTYAGLVVHHHTAATAPQGWAGWRYFRVNPSDE